MRESLRDELTACPVCGAPADTSHKDGHYERDFICYEQDKPVYYRLILFITDKISFIMPVFVGCIGRCPTDRTGC